jgi:hypothetical protein
VGEFGIGIGTRGAQLSKTALRLRSGQATAGAASPLAEGKRELAVSRPLDLYNHVNLADEPYGDVDDPLEIPAL